jgi:hypothetical protein
MPGFLLHVGATVMCMHAGQAQPTSPNPRVTVGGQPVVTQPAPYTVAGCPFFAGPSPSRASPLSGSRRPRACSPVEHRLLQDSQAVWHRTALG